MLVPTEQSFREAVAASKLWPGIAVRHSDARWVVNNSFSWDDIHQALEHFQRQRDNGTLLARYPSVLCKQMQEQRAKAADEAQSERVKRKPCLHANLFRPPSEEPTDIERMKAGIAEAAGENRGYGCIDTGVLKLLASCRADPGAAMALHVEMDGEDADNSWRRVAQAWADGRRPTNPELRPAAPVGNPRNLPSVQTILAQLGIAG